MYTERDVVLPHTGEVVAVHYVEDDYWYRARVIDSVDSTLGVSERWMTCQMHMSIARARNVSVRLERVWRNVSARLERVWRNESARPEMVWCTDREGVEEYECTALEGVEECEGTVWRNVSAWLMSAQLEMVAGDGNVWTNAVWCECRVRDGVVRMDVTRGSVLCG